jgi:hypothetical protein
MASQITSPLRASFDVIVIKHEPTAARQVEGSCGRVRQQRDQPQFASGSAELLRGLDG